MPRQCCGVRPETHNETSSREAPNQLHLPPELLRGDENLQGAAVNQAPHVGQLDTISMDKPNILVIWGDDVGVHNISAYNHGIMGYQTPNIDRIASEGAMFTDAYAQQSCTAGRASFILGQHPFRTGLLTIGMPGSDHGIRTGRRRSPTCSRSTATPPASSARTTSATGTSTCRPITASTSSSATSIT
jgi:hypothetical protein